MTAPAYDRLDQLGAATLPGFVPGSKLQVFRCSDGGAVLWTTRETGDLDGAGILLCPAQIAELHRLTAPQEEASDG